MIISMISPQAMIAAGAMYCDRFCRLAALSRKSRLAALEVADQQHRHDHDAGLLPAQEQLPQPGCAFPLWLPTQTLIGPERLTISA